MMNDRLKKNLVLGTFYKLGAVSRDTACISGLVASALGLLDKDFVFLELKELGGLIEVETVYPPKGKMIQYYLHTDVMERAKGMAEAIERGDT